MRAGRICGGDPIGRWNSDLESNRRAIQGGNTDTEPHRNLTLVWRTAGFEINPLRQIKVRLFPSYEFG